jgi:Reverse transcriptase (RNA-dependent DNA polymerase)
MIDAYSPTTQTNFDVTTSDEPTLREAMKASPQVQALWLQAIEEEFDALDCKGTWVPNLKSHKQALPTRVILKVKRNADGLVERFKARIVSGGNHQQICQDYFEKYTPVVDFAIVRVFLYITVCSNMRMAQVDVKTAFLNGELDGDVAAWCARVLCIEVQASQGAVPPKAGAQGVACQTGVGPSSTWCRRACKCAMRIHAQD